MLAANVLCFKRKKKKTYNLAKNKENNKNYGATNKDDRLVNGFLSFMCIDKYKGCMKLISKIYNMNKNNWQDTKCIKTLI